jgi:hypothetical protein
MLVTICVWSRIVAYGHSGLRARAREKGYEQTPEEAEQELRGMGVDVDGFIARARERRARQAEEER